MTQEKKMQNHKDMILQLLTIGHQIAAKADAEDHPKKHEELARQAIGYFAAASDLLNAFGALHNEMIELPQFIAARKFTRRFNF
jgi:hypothetical protein